MRKIDTLLRYNLNIHEKSSLYECEIVNGCGGKGSFDFDETLEDIIEQIKGFDENKLKILLSDIKELCIEHDIDFRFKKGFYKSNLIFAFKVFQLLGGWAGLKGRIIVFLFIFIGLNKFSKPYYLSN